jgi:hypothetical protein
VIKDVLTAAANNQSMTYGGTAPSLTTAYTINGFVNGDTKVILGSTAPALSTTVTSTTSPGSYPVTITQGTLPATLANYTYNFVNGNFQVSQAIPTLTASVVSGGVTYGDALTLKANLPAVGAGAYPTGTVTFIDGAHNWPATLSNGVATTTVTTPAVGLLTITASYAGDTNYTQASSATGVTLTVNQASQTITFFNPGPQNYRSPLTLAATASSSLAVSYTVTSGPATLNGSTLTFTGTGAVTILATQIGNSNYSAATPVSVTFMVTNLPAPTFSPSAGAYSSVATSGLFTIKLVQPAFSTSNGGQLPATYRGLMSANAVMTNTDPAATICYTTDNTTPTANSSGVCTNGTALVPGGAFTLSGLGTYYVQAIAAAANFTTSNLVSGTYVLQVEPPAFSNVGAQYPGKYAGSAIVKLTNPDPAATICYTSNNTTPTANSSGVCTNGIPLVPGVTLTLSGTGTYYVKAVAAAANSTASSMVSGTYVLY